MTVIDDTVSTVSPVLAHGAGDFAGSRRLWSLIPPDLVERFRPHATAMASAMVHEIRRAVPEYARPLDGPVGEDIRQGVRQAVLCAFSDFSGIPRQGSRGDWIRMFHHLGRVEFAERGNLDCLQTAYRVGGRVAWRHLSAFAQRHGVSSEVICVCAEAVFAYVDEICTLSGAGYAAAQAEAEGSRSRHRRVLLERILSGAARSPRAMAELAQSAGWPLPSEVTMVALSEVDGPLCLVSADADILMDLDGPQPYLLLPGDVPVPDPALPETRAAVGPKVPLADAATSLRWARRTLDLMGRGVLPGTAVQRWDDHLATMWLHSDQFLLSAMAARNLAPLDGLTPKQRSRMSATLLAWLKARGGAPDVAAQLGVHPQTARYRIRQLEELFGKSLDDPAQRFALEVTLRAQQFAEAPGDQLAARRATA
ncbi:helix-turn-helix domain-containing protein [Amycolatopsis minnesotensis]|uniref:Helix-turn-helix domain-containing protein n=1 Tax=Amycolatopsis minnesotensis TaxID=337894 RepID=A0ABN2S8Z9_9PSEU